MKIQQQWNGIVGIILVVLSMLFFPINVFADDKEEVVKTAGFTKKVKHPENQIGEGEALNLMMNEGQVQQVAVEINNLGEEELELRVSLNGARTNGNGGLEYGKSRFKKDKTMKYDITDLVTVPKTIKIPPKEKKDLVLDIKMPDVAYEGIVTGGIELQEAEVEKEEKNEGVMIVNKVAYLFGVTLKMDEKEIKPDFKAKKAYAGQQNYRNVIFVDVSNIKPVKVEGLIIDVEITQKGKKEVLYESKKNNVEMAPNTIISYPVSLNGENMQAGKYVAHIHMDGYGNEWSWKKEFTITDEEADKFNQQDVNIVQERDVNWKLIVAVILVLGVVLAIIILIGKTKKRKKKAIRKRRK